MIIQGGERMYKHTFYSKRDTLKRQWKQAIPLAINTLISKSINCFCSKIQILQSNQHPSIAHSHFISCAHASCSGQG